MAFSAHATSQGGRGVGESLILKRRQREDHLASYTECVRGLEKANSRAEWEHTLHARSEGTHVQRTLRQLKNQQESQLHSRRLKLADLYNREMEQWKHECLANVETPEDRKRHMIQRALELKERREQERRALVEAKRMQQYRESCDDVRVEDSRKVQQVVLADRDKQLDERKRLDDEEREYEARMAQLWDADRQRKETRERADRDAAIQRNDEVKAMLDLQIDLDRKRTADDEANRRAADQALLDEWQRLQQVEDALERETKQNDIARALDVKRFNQERVAASHDAAMRERQYDSALLQLALAQEADAKQREREQHDKFRREQLAFQRVLQQQIAVEAEDQSVLDKVRSDMEAMVWAKRDAQHSAEEAARHELLHQVLQSRAQQILSKQQQAEQQKRDDAAYMSQLERESDEALQQELRDHEARRDALKRNQRDLVTQLDEKRRSDEQQRQTDYLELKRMQLAEKQHKARVAQFSAAAPVVTHRRKTAQWYFDA